MIDDLVAGAMASVLIYVALGSFKGSLKEHSALLVRAKELGPSRKTERSRQR